MVQNPGEILIAAVNAQNRQKSTDHHRHSQMKEQGGAR
jgi:hypothetical protein